MTAHWGEAALCAQVGPSFFFPEDGESVEQARRICAKCPVRIECLTDAVRTAEHDGIRAGFDMRDIYMTARHTRGHVEPRKVAEEMLRRNAGCNPPSFGSTATRAA